MQVKFWGVRGSIPSPVTEPDLDWKLNSIIELARQNPSALDQPEEFLLGLPRHLKYPVGGNTACLEVTHKNERLILDMGSGLRPLGVELSCKGQLDEETIYLALNGNHGLDQAPAAENDGLDLKIFLSHTHWDHIQGFPFFTPAYNAGNRLTIYGRDGEAVRLALEKQQTAPALFPIPLSGLAAEINCLSFPPEGLTLDGLEIAALALPHPGGSLAFRIRGGGRTIVYATDYEFPSSDTPEAGEFIKFINQADVLISDTQYTYLEGVAREGWGHSTSFGALDLAMRAEVKSFYLFHHDPDHSDAKLHDNLDKSRAYYKMMSGNGQMIIGLATEGLTV